MKYYTTDHYVYSLLHCLNNAARRGSAYAQKAVKEIREKWCRSYPEETAMWLGAMFVGMDDGDAKIDIY